MSNLHRARSVMIGVALAAACTVHASQGLPGYRTLELLPAGALRSNAWDVNNLGQVAVTAWNGQANQSFIWQDGVFTPIAGPEGARDLSVFGLSDTGLAVGGYATPDLGDDTYRRSGFVFDGKNYRIVDAPGATTTDLRGVSPDGRWVSGMSDGQYKGFLLDLSTGQFVSVAAADAVFSIVQGINAHGLAVGHEERAESPDHVAFVFDLNTGERIDTAWGAERRSAFRDIDSRGRIAGWYEWLEDPPPRPPEGGPVPIPMLGALGTPDDYTTFQWLSMRRTTFQGINDRGWLAGNVDDIGADIGRGFVAIPVPEPGTVPLMLAGVAFLVAAVRPRVSR